jgi:hypothetical protein
MYIIHVCVHVRERTCMHEPPVGVLHECGAGCVVMHVAGVCSVPRWW